MVISVGTKFIIIYVADYAGESWGHLSTNRIILYWQDGMRHAYLCKSPNRPEACVTYQITVGNITIAVVLKYDNNVCFLMIRLHET